MKPEQLIAEVEALLPSGPDQVVTKFYKWRLLAPLVLDALKAMQDALERLTADLAAERSRCAMLDGLRERDEKNPPPQLIALKNEVERLTAERDEATKRAAEWEIQAQDFRDRVVKAEAERDELRARLSEREEECRELESRRLMAYRAYCDVSRRLDEEERERKEDRARAMARIAELESALATLRAAQTPRPIEEAPKDGTWILGLWPQLTSLGPEVLRWVGPHDWERTSDDFHYAPTHFLPLPVKP